MNSILALLINYKYLVLFPLAIFEGPIITVIAGFFVTTGFFNPFFVYAIVAVGDIVGDSFYYMLGRGGGILFQKFFRRHIDSEKTQQARQYFINHHNKALILSKVIHGIGVSGLIAAGSLKIPYKRFFLVCTLISAAQSFVLLIIGILFGNAYFQISKYFNFFGGVMAIIVISIIIVFLVKKYRIYLR